MIKLFGAEFKNKKSLVGFFLTLTASYTISKLILELLIYPCL